MQWHRVVYPIDPLVMPVCLLLAQPGTARPNPPQLGWALTSWLRAVIKAAGMSCEKNRRRTAPPRTGAPTDRAGPE